MEHKKHLEKLADYLDSLPDDYQEFDMTDYQIKNDGRWCGYKPIRKSCGTVACAAGHGPNAGIKPLDDENWATYSIRLAGHCDRSWNWLFSAWWIEYDNTLQGAVKRIRYYLKHGVPAWFNNDDFLHVNEYYQSTIENI